MKQSNILAQAERLLGKKEFNIDIDKIMQFLRSAKGDYIYPDAIQRYTEGKIVDIYEMLELLSEKDIMEQRLDKLFAMPDAVKGRYDDFEKYIEKHEMAD